jgi:hypothetical protein
VPKLVASGFDERKAIVIFGYDYDGWLMDPAVEAFRLLSGSKAELAECATASFDGLVHPVHRRGHVFGWELHPFGTDSR